VGQLRALLTDRSQKKSPPLLFEERRLGSCAPNKSRGRGDCVACPRAGRPKLKRDVLGGCPHRESGAKGNPLASNRRNGRPGRSHRQQCRVALQLRPRRPRAGLLGHSRFAELGVDGCLPCLQPTIPCPVVEEARERRTSSGAEGSRLARTSS